MPHPQMFDDADPVLARVRAFALALPDAAEKVSHGAPAFFTTKVFAYYGGGEKTGAAHVRHSESLLVLADAAERPALLAQDHTYLPAYLGPSGWVGVRLEPGTDWDEIAELIETSYRLTAGVRRLRSLDEARAEDS